MRNRAPPAADRDRGRCPRRATPAGQRARCYADRAPVLGRPAVLTPSAAGRAKSDPGALRADAAVPLSPIVTVSHSTIGRRCGRRPAPLAGVYLMALSSRLARQRFGLAAHRSTRTAGRAQLHRCARAARRRRPGGGRVEQILDDLGLSGVPRRGAQTTRLQPAQVEKVERQRLHALEVEHHLSGELAGRPALRCEPVVQQRRRLGGDPERLFEVVRDHRQQLGACPRRVAAPPPRRSARAARGRRRSRRTPGEQKERQAQQDCRLQHVAQTVAGEQEAEVGAAGDDGRQAG